MLRALVLAGAVLSAGQSASALTPLKDNATVVNAFYAIGFADEIRKNCAEIEPRWLTAWNFLKSLESYAREAGYTEDDVRDLRRDKAARRALERRIREDLAARGATPQTPEGYCSVGREEIARDSTAGRLLRAN